MGLRNDGTQTFEIVPHRRRKLPNGTIRYVVSLVRVFGASIDGDEGWLGYLTIRQVDGDKATAIGVKPLEGNGKLCQDGLQILPMLRDFVITDLEALRAQVPNSTTYDPRSNLDANALLPDARKSGRRDLSDDETIYRLSKALEVRRYQDRNPKPTWRELVNLVGWDRGGTRQSSEKMLQQACELLERYEASSNPKKQALLAEAKNVSNGKWKEITE
jgi:hypothetical protein